MNKRNEMKDRKSSFLLFFFFDLRKNLAELMKRIFVMWSFTQNGLNLLFMLVMDFIWNCWKIPTKKMVISLFKSVLWKIVF